MKAPHLETLAGELACEGRHCTAAESMLDTLVRGFAAYLAARAEAGAGFSADELPRLVENFALVEQHHGRAAFHREQYRKAAGEVLRRARQLGKGAACLSKC
jgi:hypothetical protein